MSIGQYQPKKITALFDAQCPLCIRIAEWLEREPCFVELELLPMQSQAARSRFPEVVPEVDKGNFVVVDDRGGVYIETAGRLMCLYATKRYRELSFKLASPLLRPAVDRFFSMVAKNRQRISRAAGLEAKQAAECNNNQCKTSLFSEDHR